MKSCCKGLSRICREDVQIKFEESSDLVKTLHHIYNPNFDYFAERHVLKKHLHKCLQLDDQKQDYIKIGSSYLEFTTNCKNYFTNNNNPTTYYKLTHMDAFWIVNLAMIENYILTILKNYIGNTSIYKKPYYSTSAIELEIYKPRLGETVYLVHLNGERYDKIETKNQLNQLPCLRCKHKDTNDIHLLCDLSKFSIDSKNTCQILLNGVLMLNTKYFNIQNFVFDIDDNKSLSVGNFNINYDSLSKNYFKFNDIGGQYQSKRYRYILRCILTFLILSGLVFDLVDKIIEIDVVNNTSSWNVVKMIIYGSGIIISILYWFKDLNQSCLDIFKVKGKYSWKHLNGCKYCIKICECVGFCCCNKTKINDPEEFDV